MPDWLRSNGAAEPQPSWSPRRERLPQSRSLGSAWYKVGLGVLGWVLGAWDADEALMPRDRQAGPQRCGGGGRSLLPDAGSGGIFLLCGSKEIPDITGEWALDLKEAQV